MDHHWKRRPTTMPGASIPSRRSQPPPIAANIHSTPHRLRTPSPTAAGGPISFKRERLQALNDLVSKALEAGHIEPYSGPGNNPVFPVKKPNGKWRFIHDLRATNAIATTLTSPSPGPPDLTSLPTALPHLQTIDLTDAFFQIPLPKQFQPYFAFTIPQPCNYGPGTRYAWTVLPQGFKNSPTLFEQQLAAVLNPMRKMFPTSTIVQYMDDILLASPTNKELQQLSQLTLQALTTHGLPISQEKTQRTPGQIRFLGQVISPNHITYESTPAIPIKSQWTLTELQVILRKIQWVSKGTPILRRHLQSLYSALHGYRDPRACITLTPQQLHALHAIQQALQHNCRGRLDPTLPLLGLISLSTSGTTSVIFQPKQNWPLAWLHTPHPPTSLCPWGHLLACTIPTLDKFTLQHYGQLCQSFHHNMSKQALCDFLRNSPHPSVGILIHHMGRFHNLGSQPSGPWKTLLHLPTLLQEPRLLRPIFTLSPVVLDTAPCLFSDGSPQKAAYVLWDQTILQQDITPLPPHVTNSAQKGELLALICGLRAAKPWPSLNIFLDSKYLIKYLHSLAIGAFLGTSAHQTLQAALPPLLQGKTIYLHHVRSHTNLPDPISTFNEYTDSLIVAPLVPLTPQGLHGLTHCNQRALVSFGATPKEAKSLVQTCHTCQIINSQHHMPQGHIRRGLLPNHIWQGDVTHYKYKKYKYCLHVWVDTFSGAVSVSCKKKETSCETISAFLQAISLLGKPLHINTDNGPAFLSQEFQEFCTSYHIKHSTHIPYNPTSSGLVERTNGIIKNLLNKYLLDCPNLPLDNAINKALWTLNQLNVMNPSGKTRWQIHHSPPLPPIPEASTPPKPPSKWFYYKLPGLTNQRWKGPLQSLQEAGGAALLSIDGFPRWIPWRFLKKAACPRPDASEPAEHAATDHQHHG
uniref:Reverse transcriptase n=1 Tax=Human T-cell leukemia virus 2 TaxID=11909 RepID=Q9WS58_HTLV2|nr:reverse transcriptase [Human T-lymphotropic virus 2]